ncbi:hypothetical protein [Bordetella bronchiseptica]|uniref:Uncharacterized protein n=1 Tax=Bordetella bronchiseptica (strain ATCC BAA-588 / NCTC 13252 / RB50) TaxID=257310 RepID=A0A0H3LK02_BORBR|nr:hypothetical protein [Bordetella bronchiseptica]AMG87957.1 hypothetical protein AL472_09220 [Bordetella bronchiseptica]AUL14772.1 hypothetical protein BTL45_07690 [Bordetella bronchiseptica]AWP57868.1 hypothetical protein B7P02_07645 [Bordetella bronchiseptica]AWQ04601.1 hypothetical protein B9G73_07610 [Bordetella bronchiseptica]AZW30165.1 hypothetical protein CS343_07990 [Bordetella bronchiseptica]
MTASVLNYTLRQTSQPTEAQRRALRTLETARQLMAESGATPPAADPVSTEAELVAYLNERYARPVNR